jgi:hypothetical protein
MTAAQPPPRGLFDTVRHTFRGVVALVRPPRLDVTVTLPGDGRRTGDTGPEADTAIADAIARVIGAHATALGVPAQPAVTVSDAPAGTNGAPRLLIDGRPVRLVTPGSWRAFPGAPDAATQGPDRLASLAAACEVIVERDPSVLVGRAQAAALVSRARAAGIVDHPDEFVAAALKHVVAQGVSVADLVPLAAALQRQDDVVDTPGEFAEVAIDTLRPDSIGVRIRKSTLRQVTASGVSRDAFVDMRHRLFADLGVTYPDIELVLADELPEGTCALRLNHVKLRPRRLPVGADLFDVAAFVEQELRRYASWFVTVTEARSRVDDLRLALPELVAMVQEYHSIPRLGLLTRALVEEQVPVRNATRLMILLLDMPAPGVAWDVVRLAEPCRGAGSGASSGSGAPCPRQLVSYARQQINEELARLTNVMFAADPVRLPPELDAALDALPGWDGLAPAEVRNEHLERLFALADVAAGKPQPTLVAASQRSRAVARNLLAGQYPEVTVLAAEEFPPSHR